MSSATLLTPVRPKPPARRPSDAPAPLSAPPADPWLALAVSAAVGGPDRFAARTPDGAGKEPFVLAVAGELARLGDRLLVVGIAPDVWTRRLGEGLAVVRAASVGETVPDEVLPRTSAVLAAAVARGLDESIREANEQLARWDAALPQYTTAADTAPLATAAPPPAVVTAASERLPHLREQWNQLAPLAEAKKCGRVATGAFWKAVFTGDVAARACEVEKQIHEAEATVRAGEAAEDFRSACDRLRSAGLPAPDEASAAAVAEASARAQAVRRAEADRLAAALAEREELAAGRLPLAGVVVAAPNALADPAVTAAPFDRVIVDTDGLTDADVSAALSLAPRAVLVGAFDRPGLAAGCWADLPKPAWATDAGRLVVTLEPLTDVAFEPLADRPDVRVGLGTRADGTPAVGVVSFPAGVSAAEAVGFLARELGEVRAVGVGLMHRHEQTVCWPLAGAAADWVELEPGLSMGVTSAAGRPLTAAVRFDPEAWPPAAVEDWLGRHLNPPRAVCLAGR